MDETSRLDYEALMHTAIEYAEEEAAAYWAGGDVDMQLLLTHLHSAEVRYAASDLSAQSYRPRSADELRHAITDTSGSFDGDAFHTLVSTLGNSDRQYPST
jgi:hypothetical protein